MKNIKIRAWDDVLEKILYSKTEQFDDSLGYRFDEHFETDTPIYMLSTEEKDRDGEELWFGDMVQIYYGNRLDSTILIDGIAALVALIIEQTDSGATYKIIGNMHEGPDLREL